MLSELNTLALVAFPLLGLDTREEQIKGRKIYFGSLFQRFKAVCGKWHSLKEVARSKAGPGQNTPVTYLL